MRKIIFYALVISIGVFNSPSYAQNTAIDGNWGVTFQGDYKEHYLSSSRGDTFIITCPRYIPTDKKEYNELSDQLKRSIANPASISISIKKSKNSSVEVDPPSKSKIKIKIDNSRLTLDSDRVEKDAVVLRLIAYLRKGKHMTISFSDGRTARFKIKGAREAFEGSECKSFKPPTSWQ